MKAKAEAPRKNHTNPVKRFFINIWQWFKETAWIQVLLIVGLIIGIVMSITPLVGWISGLVEKSKESTFYKDNKITYSNLQTKNEGSDENYVVIFISDTCPNCKGSQKYIEAWSKEHSELKFYTINTSDEDAITDEDLINLNTIYLPVYNNQDDDIKNSSFNEYPDKFQTPTIAWYKDAGAEPYRVFLGVDYGSKADAYSALNKYFEVE